MKNLSIALVCSLLYFIGFAQNSNMAIVTNVDYFLNTSTFIDTESFPMYFHHREFMVDVQGDIEKHIKEKFHSDTVIFLNPDSISYSSGTFAPSQNAKEIAKSSGVKGNLYIQIRTNIIERISMNDALGFGFNTKIRVFDHRGRTKYKFRHVIPFSIVVGEEITGNIELSEQDFYALYFDGLKQAFDGSTKIASPIDILKPQTNHYNDFLSSANKYYIQQTGAGYEFGENLDSLGKALTFKTDRKTSRDGQSVFTEIFDNNRVRDGYMVQNVLSDKNYTAQLQGKYEEWFKFFSSSTPIEVKLKDNSIKEIGQFNLDWDSSKLTGTINNRDVEVNWKGEFDCSEIYLNEKLAALIVLRNNYYVVFISNSLSNENRGDLLDIVFVWDFSHEVKAKIMEKIDDE